MSRLPNALQPAWPLVKRAHRLLTLLLGFLSRRLGPVTGSRGLPTHAFATAAQTAASEPAAVRLHPVAAGEHLQRTPPPGGHWVFEAAATYDVPDRFVLEMADGTVVGDYGANVTPGGALDFETSEYFGISGWREHPIFLRSRLPEVEHVDGSLVSLATRGGSNNYYHFLFDVLPRWGMLREAMPDLRPDALYVPTATTYHRQLLAIAGLDRHRILETRKHRAVRADRLLVPSLPNPDEMAPPWLTEWVRRQFPPVALTDRPNRIYVTRGGGPHTRRLVEEPMIWPMLERRGFTRIDPGRLSVQDQIDHFAAAEVIVGLHGAALTNLAFAQPGVRVLELFAPVYVKHCFWAITESIPDARYRYLLGAGPDVAPGRPMNRIQADIELGAGQVEAALDDLLAD